MEERNVVRYVRLLIRNLPKNCEIKTHGFESSWDNSANDKARDLVTRTGCNLAIRYDNRCFSSRRSRGPRFHVR